MNSRAYNIIYGIITSCIIILSIAVRVYKIDSPVGDWHSWRQADTAAVARNFITWGFDPFRPRYDDLSNIQTGKDNPHGWRMVEFPIYQSIAYGWFKVFSYFPIEVWLRIVTISASVGTGILLLKIVSLSIDRFTGVIALFIYSVLPFSIYYGRTILPDTSMVFFIFLSLYFLVIDTESRNKWLFLTVAGVCAGIALLIKPTGIFLLLSSLYLLFRKDKKPLQLVASCVIYFGLALVPLLLWRNWILQFTEGIPAYDWLFNKDYIRFKGAWFYWLFADRIGRLIMGYWGLIFFGIGLITAFSKREGWLFRWLLVGCLLYFVVIAGGNVQHDYYQILIIPILSVYIAKGIVDIIRTSHFQKPFAYFFSGIIFLFMMSFSWYTIRTYYWINRQDLLAAGVAADELLPKDAKVIAPNNGDTTFLYFIKRQGWPIGFDIDKKIALGATHYVTVSSSDNDFETKELVQKYKVLVRNEHFAIIELK